MSKRIILLASVVCLVFSLAAQANGIDWRQQEGASINVLFCRMPYADTLIPLIPEFEAKTGIKVRHEVLSEVEFRDKLLMDLSSRAGNYDAFLLDPLFGWQYADAGWLEPLDAYLDDPDLTDKGFYQQKDFIQTVWEAGKWNLEPLTGLGEGSTWAIPVNTELYVLAYLTDVFDDLGLSVPETYDELYATAVKATRPINGRQIYGFSTRGAQYWSTFLVPYGSYFYSYGGRFFDENLNTVVNESQVVRATEDFVRLLKDAGPPGVLSFDWYESQQSFATGNYAMILEADLFAPFWEDASRSEVAGRVGYALAPKGPHSRRTLRYIWQIGMNSASKNKDATWLFLQWGTSKDVLNKTHAGGNMNPVRSSGWEYQPIVDQVKNWGAVPDQYRQVSQEMSTHYSAFYIPPHPEAIRLMDRMSQVVQEVYEGIMSAEDALAAAARDIERINRQAGIVK